MLESSVPAVKPRESGLFAFIYVALGFFLVVEGLPFVTPSLLTAVIPLLVAFLAVTHLSEIGNAVARVPRLWKWLAFMLLLTTVASDQLTEALLVAAVFTFGVIGYALGRSRVRAEYVRLGLLIGCTISSTVLLIAALGGPDLQATIGTGRGLWGLSYRSTAFSYTAALGYVLCLSSIFNSDRQRRRYVAMVFCIFFAVAATASGSRGGLVAMGLATLFIWISAARESSRLVRRRRRTTLIAIVIAVVFLLAPAMGLSGGIDRLIRYDEVTVGGSEYTSGRGNAIASAYDLILSSPVIGHGTPLLNKDTQQKLAAVPHNGLLQVGLRGGIVAMLIALAVIGLALLQASRFVFHHTAASGIVAVLFVRVFISSSGPLDSVTLALLFMLAWAEIRSVNSELRSNAASE